MSKEDRVPSVKSVSTGARRLPPEQRRREIVTKAVEFFAAHGFEEGTRELANHLGITQPLLYRYFPTKEAIIEEVYKEMYLGVWKNSWDELLINRQIPLQDRLREFYNEYTDAIMNEQWMRIYFFSGLRGADINKKYIKFIEERILRRIILEFIHEYKVNIEQITMNRQMEIAWLMQGAIFYYGVRLYVYGIETYASKNEVIDDAIRIFFAGYRDIVENHFDLLRDTQNSDQTISKKIYF